MMTILLLAIFYIATMLFVAIFFIRKDVSFNIVSFLVLFIPILNFIFLIYIVIKNFKSIKFEIKQQVTNFVKEIN